MNGGSQYRLESAWEKAKMDDTSKAKKLGSLVHAYADNPNQFVFEPEWEQISDKIQEIIAFIWSITHKPLIECEEEILSAAEGIKYGQSWKPDTVIKKVIESGGPLYQFYLAAEGKIPIHGKDLEAVQGIIKSIKDHGALRPILEDSTNCDFFVREYPILFTIDDKFPAKVLLDIMEVNHAMKTVQVTDIKTSGTPVGKFLGSHTYVYEDNMVREVLLSGPYVKYNYFTQEYFYKMAVREWLKAGGYNPTEYDITFNFAVVETKEPFEYQDYFPSSGWGMVAGKEINAALSCASDWFQVKKYWKF